MKSTTWLIAGLTGLFVLVSGAQTKREASASAKHKPVVITRLYTGPDGLTHAEEMEAKFTPGTTNDVFKLMANAGAELHRAAPGTFNDWHTAPRRQYVITLSGHGEIEVSGGKKISVGPGN